jgi:hypothetical protein
MTSIVSIYLPFVSLSFFFRFDSFSFLPTFSFTFTFIHNKTLGSDSRLSTLTFSHIYFSLQRRLSELFCSIDNPKLCLKLALVLFGWNCVCLYIYTESNAVTVIFDNDHEQRNAVKSIESVIIVMALKYALIYSYPF